MAKKEYLTIRLDDELKDTLLQEALRQERSLASVARLALREYAQKLAAETAPNHEVENVRETRTVHQ